MSDDVTQQIEEIDQELNELGRRAVALKGLRREIQFRRELDKLAQQFAEHIARVLCHWLLNRIEAKLEAAQDGVLDRIDNLRESLVPENLLASWRHFQVTSFSDTERFSNFNRNVSDEIAQKVLNAAVELYHQDYQWPTLEVVVTDKGKPIIRIA
ncbi:MAG: hypothetical protein WBB94_00235 [Candidatus Saccharimonadaceae bacterium]